jgi:hypothetical protein
LSVRKNYDLEIVDDDIVDDDIRQDHYIFDKNFLCDEIDVQTNDNDDDHMYYFDEKNGIKIRIKKEAEVGKIQEEIEKYRSEFCSKKEKNIDDYKEYIVNIKKLHNKILILERFIYKDFIKK